MEGDVGREGRRRAASSAPLLVCFETSRNEAAAAISAMARPAGLKGRTAAAEGPSSSSASSSPSSGHTAGSWHPGAIFLIFDRPRRWEDCGDHGNGADFVGAMPAPTSRPPGPLAAMMSAVSFGLPDAAEAAAEAPASASVAAWNAGSTFDQTKAPEAEVSRDFPRLVLPFEDSGLCPVLCPATAASPISECQKFASKADGVGGSAGHICGCWGVAVPLSSHIRARSKASTFWSLCSHIFAIESI
mmetsp:Transcript_171160/g.548624  ORF Transcript_171160/g.548624 Transcript_171160/m.548624 type:complete len:245 (+) Transcript_171160:715-1449(+)